MFAVGGLRMPEPLTPTETKPAPQFSKARTRNAIFDTSKFMSQVRHDFAHRRLSRNPDFIRMGVGSR